jgi:hypothetical protein
LKSAQFPKLNGFPFFSFAVRKSFYHSFNKVKGFFGQNYQIVKYIPELQIAGNAAAGENA